MIELARPGELERLLHSCSEEELKLVDLILNPTSLWIPSEGPQTEAYLSPADDLFYGGAAGGGKSDLGIGLAVTAHQRSLILRRTYPEAQGLMERIREVCGARAMINNNDHIVRLDGGQRMIEYGHCQHEKDKEKYQGRAHDLKLFDEVTGFARTVWEYIIRWCRSADPNQRCRTVSTFNPPKDTEGMWVVEFLLPWMAYLWPLKFDHPNPAKPGEIRWFARLGEDIVEVEDGRVFEHEGELIYPRSRTFIPAKLDDNPFLTANAQYRANLQAAPLHLRRMLLYGEMHVGAEDDVWQLIPSRWLELSHERWAQRGKPKDERGNPISPTTLGVDVARGGSDQTVIAPLYDNWMGELRAWPGVTTPNGETAGQRVLECAPGSRPRIGIDIIGPGSAVYDWLAAQGSTIYPINGSASTKRRSKQGTFGFQNTRALMYWMMREALDPDGDVQLALPPDPLLDAELRAHRYDTTPKGIKIQAKEEIVEKIGRSPDRADAACYAVLMAHTGY